MEIKIRNLSPKVVKTLDDMAKEKGYKSREEFLRSYLTNLTTISEFKELENKYTKLLNTTHNLIEMNTEVLNKFMNDNLIEITD